MTAQKISDWLRRVPPDAEIRATVEGCWGTVAEMWALEDGVVLSTLEVGDDE